MRLLGRSGPALLGVIPTLRAASLCEQGWKSSPTFVVVAVAIWVVALPKQLQVLLITQGFAVGKAGMARQDLLQMFMD